jgi:hypothetical protein
MKMIYSFLGFRNRPLVKVFVRKETLELLESREKAFLEKVTPVLDKYSKDYPSSGVKNAIARCKRLEKRKEDIKKAIELTKAAKAANEKLHLSKSLDCKSMEVDSITVSKETVALPNVLDVKLVGQDQALTCTYSHEPCPPFDSA